jgi:K+:H+ antiporter
VICAAATSRDRLADSVQALARADVEEILLPILLQLVLIIAAARVLALLFRRLGQPGVVGEIAAGLILGPSLLGRLGFVHDLFHPSIHGVSPELSEPVFHWIFAALSQLGLILLLFLVGLEFEFQHLRSNGKSALGIAVAGMIVPFALGVGVAVLLLGHAELGSHPAAPDVPPPALGFALFLGTALAITALPVLGRILMELRLTRTRLGTVAITAAAGNDAVGWILLAAVAAVVRAHFDPGDTLRMVGATLAFALVMIYIVKPLLRRWVRSVLARHQGEPSINVLAAVLVVILLCAIATNVIGIFAIFGAFFLGAVLSSEEPFREALARRLRDFVTAFFVPIFFAYTGLRTRVDALGTWELWAWCGVVIAAAVVGKLGGCFLAARVSGYLPREAACIGAMMNTRGLMELIVVNVGYDLRVIPESIYCMLVLMAVVTTIMTTPLVLWLARGTELEESLRRSGYLDRRESAVPAASSRLL